MLEVSYPYSSHQRIIIKRLEFSNNIERIHTNVKKKSTQNILDSLICSVEDEVWDSYKSCILLKNRIENNHNNVSVVIKSFQNSGHMLTIPFQPNNRYSKRNKVSVMQDAYRSWFDTVNFF
ncbi:acyl-CoA thioester hydrolase/BAAT C-terminal domain-containing protein [Limosilactobacillus equigenerosi]